MTNRTEVPAEFRSAPATASTSGPGATNKQLNYIASLLQERELEAEHRDAISARLAVQVNANEEHGDETPCDGGISKKRASEWIGRLVQKPKRQAQKPERESGNPMPPLQGGHGVAVEGKTFLIWPMIPDGRYAIEVADDELNPIHFFTVRTSKHGDEWDGFQGLKRHAGDERYKVKGAKRREVLNLIAEDPRAAAIRYGAETNHCCVCGRELTRRLSRELGIGPVCGRRFDGDDWAGRVEAAREAIVARGEDPDETIGDEPEAIPCMACGSTSPGDGSCRCFV